MLLCSLYYTCIYIHIPLFFDNCEVPWLVLFLTNLALYLFVLAVVSNLIMFPA